MVKNKILSTLIVMGMLIGTGIMPAGAALQGFGPVDAVNGFPIWYQDSNLLKLGLCVDNNAFCLFDPVESGKSILGGDRFRCGGFLVDG